MKALPVPAVPEMREPGANYEGVVPDRRVPLMDKGEVLGVFVDSRLAEETKRFLREGPRR